MSCQLLIVPGLRDAVPDHWQTRLAHQRPDAVVLPPLGRDNLSLSARLADLEQAVALSPLPVLIVAHSGGCVLVAHWARQTRLATKVAGALLATPPTFDAPLPAGYPPLKDLQAAGWLPMPREALAFPSLVAASRNDPLGDFDAVLALARDWNSAVEDLGPVGHLNPASGFGEWPLAHALIARMSAAAHFRRHPSPATPLSRAPAPARRNKPVSRVA